MLPDLLRLPEFGVPVADLTINGLALCRFDQKNKNWKIAYISTDEHNHKLLFKLRQIDKFGRIKKGSETKTWELSQAKRIHFSIDNGSTSHYSPFPAGYYTAPKEFSRRGTDSNDFRWVIDFLGQEVPHGVCQGLSDSIKGEGVRITVVEIPHALFYTKRVSADCMILAPASQERGPDEDGFVLGRTNEEIGAGFYATKPSGKLSVTADGKPIFEGDLTQEHMFEMFLVNADEDKVTGVGWKRKSESIRYEGNSAYRPGDFAELYKVVKVSGTQQQIFAPKRDVFRDGEGDCSPGFMSSENAPANLLKLLS